MSLTIPSGLRYRVVNILESEASSFNTTLIRTLMWIGLTLMGVPWSVSREVAYGVTNERPDLKATLRSMLWIWNRSWLPFKFNFGTFFDIGWYLSDESCRRLEKRGFLNHSPLKHQVDLAQLKLATIKHCVKTNNHTGLVITDQELRAIVNRVMNQALDHIDSGGSGKPDDESLDSVSVNKEHSANIEFDNDRTRSALLDFDNVCKSIDLTYFLVSGTFLGVVRDSAFIGHDHDIDVGIFEEDLSENLVPAFIDSEEFTVNQSDYICLRKGGDSEVKYSFMKTPAIIRLAHHTGISIDVFVHFPDVDLSWHGSSVHRWNNKTFELCDYEFLGRTFKGAENHDLYLSENYGPDWRIPKAVFNVNLDTPNMSFVGTANALVFFSWLVANAAEEGNADRVRKYIDMLITLGALELKEGVVSVR